MLLTEDEKELYSRVMADLFDDISTEDIAGKMGSYISTYTGWQR